MKRLEVWIAAAVLSMGVAGGAAAAELTIAIPAGSDSNGLRAAGPIYGEMMGIDVTVVEAPYEALYEKTANDAMNKTGNFDLIMIDAVWGPFFFANGLVEELNPYYQALGTDGPDNDFIWTTLALCRWPYETGRYVCLPYNGNSQLYFYDHAALAEAGLQGAPDTWEKLLPVLEKISEEGGGRKFGYIVRGQQGDPIVSNFLPVLWSFGGSMFDENGDPSMNNANAQQALDFYLKLRNVSPPGAAIFDADEIATYLSTGGVVSAINWPNWIALYEDPEQSRVVGKMAYGRIPNGTHVGKSHIGIWQLLIPKGSENKQAAFDFEYWATSKEQIKIATRDHGTPPVRFSVFTDPELTSQPAFRYLPHLLDSLTYSQHAPLEPRWFEILDSVGVYLSEAVAGEKTVAEALDAAQTALVEIRAKDQ